MGRTKAASRPAAEPRPSGVPVPCCQCGQPTSMRVPAEMLDAVEIFHLCPTCARPERAAGKAKKSQPVAPA